MLRQQIAIVDYGVGNLHSVAKAMTLVAPNADVVITHDHKVIANAERIIFPGVGSMADCMKAIHQHQLPNLMAEQIKQKPVMGICVGMQALMKSSCEHGEQVAGLGYFNADVKWFNDAQLVVDNNLKVPHMGWNNISMREHRLWDGINSAERFYFVHSYYVSTADLPPVQVAASCDYGVSFSAAVIKSNLFAVQFHPEKSHNSGLQLLKNFTQWKGSE